VNDAEFGALEEALRALAALNGETLSAEDLEAMGPDFARLAGIRETLRGFDVSGYEPDFIAPLRPEVHRD
jgi:hypothetical protein